MLKGGIDVSRLSMPEEIKGEYKSSLTGKGTYYFDLDNWYYVGADIEISKDIMMDFETGEDDDYGMYTKIKSSDVIKIRLEKIVE